MGWVGGKLDLVATHDQVSGAPTLLALVGSSQMAGRGNLACANRMEFHVPLPLTFDFAQHMPEFQRQYGILMQMGRCAVPMFDQLVGDDLMSLCPELCG